MSKTESRLIKQNVVLFGILLIMAIIAFVLNISIGNTNEAISEADKDRELALQVVDELRQSSDDLTRMARMYVVTEDTSYIQYFNDIIKIRDGKASRPIDYHEIYWDFVLASGTAPRPRKEQIGLVNILQSYISSNEAAEYFMRAKRSSDDLIQIEEEAFNAIKGLYKDSLGKYSIIANPNRQMAIDLLHGKAYLVAKAKIMKSIQDFYHFVNGYTYDTINELSAQLDWLNWMLISVVMISIMALIVVVFTNVRFLLHSRTEKKADSISGKFSFAKFLKEVGHSWVVVLMSFVFSTLVIVFLVYANSSIKKNVEQSISQSLLTVNQTTNKNIQDWLTDLEKSASILAASESTHDDFISLLNGETAPYENGLDKSITSNVFQTSYAGYVIVNQDLIVLQSSLSNLNGQSLNELERAEALTKMHNNQFSALSFPCKMGSSDSYNRAIKVSSPIVDENEVLRGRLILLFNPKERFTEVLQQGRLGNSGESYAFNNQGVMISDSRFNEQLIAQGFIDKGQSSELNIELKDPTDPEKGYTLMAKDALKGYAGVNVTGYNDYRGIKVVGTWNWFEKYGFGIATEIDYDEAFKTYLLTNKLGLSTGILFILLIIALTIVFVLSRLKLSHLNHEMDKQTSLLTSLLNSIPDLIFYKNRDSEYLGANSAFEELVGKKVSEFIGQTDEALFPNEVASGFLENDKKMLAEGLAKSNEEEVTYPDGRKVILDTLKTPFHSHEGELLGLIGISRNVTENKEAEKILSDERQRFKQLLESTPDAIIIIGENGLIQVVNNKMLKLFGYAKSEVIGEPLEILIPNEIGEKHISHRNIFFKNPSSRNMGERNDLFAIRKDKSQFPVEISLNPIETNDGILVAAAIRDITERKEAEERIKASESKFRSIASTATDAIVSANNKGIIESWNKAAEQIFGYSENEALGKHLDLIVPNDFKPAHREGINRVVKGGKRNAIGKTVELVGLHKDGSTFPIDLSLSTWGEKENMKFSGIIRNITERKEYERVIEDANKRMSGELNVAKDIQMSMLPLIFPAFPKRKELDVYAELLPAREVGGDFYDFFFVDEDHFCMVVGDVSGKGVPAALMMAVCKTLIKSNSRNVYHTSKVLTWVNNEMAKENENAMFVTVFMGILNTKTGEFTYTNAGHNPTFIKRADGSVDKLTDLHGVVIAAMEGLKYKESKIMLNPGDIIFAYTDGIPEAHNAEGKMFGDDRLSNLLLAPFDSPKQLIKTIVKDVKSFEGDMEAFDDLTALSVHFKGYNNKTNSES